MLLQAVIFDFDGVLCATVDYHYQSWKKVCERYRIPFTRQDNEKLRGLTRPRSLEVILAGRQFSEQQKKEMLRLKNEIYLELIEAMTPEDLLPGIARLLQELRTAGLKIGVASGSRNARPVIERLGVNRYMDAILDGNQIKRSKPAPDVYLATARQLQVPPRACLAIEDSQAGIQAAQSAGMCTVGLGSPRLVGQAQAIFPDLSQVYVGDLVAIYKWWHATYLSSSKDIYEPLSSRH